MTKETNPEALDNNPNGSCAICDGKRCLCDVVFTLKREGGYSQEYYWKCKDEDAKKIPSHIALVGEGPEEFEPKVVKIKGKEKINEKTKVKDLSEVTMTMQAYTPPPKDDAQKKYSLDFEVTGECISKVIKLEECCGVEQCHYVEGRLEWHDIKKNKGTFYRLAFDEGEAFMFGGIDDRGFKPNINTPTREYLLTEMKNPDNKFDGMSFTDTVAAIWKWHLNFLFFSELKDFPFSLQDIIVYECDQRGGYAEEVIMQIGSFPYYHQRLTATFKDSVEVTYEIALDKTVLEFKLPIGEYNSISLIGPILKVVMGNPSKTFPGIRLTLLSPKIEISATAQLGSNTISANQNADQKDQQGDDAPTIIQRSGGIKADPLIGFELAFDLFKPLQSALTASGIGAPIALAIAGVNDFNNIKDVKEASDLLERLKGESSWLDKLFKARTAAAFFVQGRVEVGGVIKLQDSDIFGEDGTSYVDAEINGGAILGLYGGAWVEGRVLGFGAGGGISAAAVVSWEFLYHLETMQLVGWYKGFDVQVAGEVSVGWKDANEKGGFSDATVGVKAKERDVPAGVELSATEATVFMEFEIEISEGSSRDQATLIYDFNKEPETDLEESKKPRWLEGGIGGGAGLY